MKERVNNYEGNIVTRQQTTIKESGKVSQTKPTKFTKQRARQFTAQVSTTKKKKKKKDISARDRYYYILAGVHDQVKGTRFHERKTPPREVSTTAEETVQWTADERKIKGERLRSQE